MYFAGLKDSYPRDHLRNTARALTGRRRKVTVTNVIKSTSSPFQVKISFECGNSKYSNMTNGTNYFQQQLYVQELENKLHELKQAKAINELKHQLLTVKNCYGELTDNIKKATRSIEYLCDNQDELQEKITRPVKINVPANSANDFTQVMENVTKLLLLHFKRSTNYKPSDDIFAPTDLLNNCTISMERSQILYNYCDTVLSNIREITTNGIDENDVSKSDSIGTNAKEEEISPQCDKSVASCMGYTFSASKLTSSSPI